MRIEMEMDWYRSYSSLLGAEWLWVGRDVDVEVVQWMSWTGHPIGWPLSINRACLRLRLHRHLHLQVQVWLHLP